MLISNQLITKTTMVFNRTQISLILFASTTTDIPTTSSMKIYSQDQIQFRRETKRTRQSKNHKRYRQIQPRNRGTNHTLMRKGNTW